MSETVKRLNKSLAERYGSNLHNQQLFRISWSDEQLEKRFGKYREFSGKIFLREFSGLLEVPKYPQIKRMWVLERWLPPELAYTNEIPDTANGSYEPLFVFMDENSSPLPIIDEQVYRIIYTALHPQMPGDRASDLKAQEKIEFDQEVKQTTEELEEAGRTWIGHRLHSKEGIIRP